MADGGSPTKEAHAVKVQGGSVAWQGSFHWDRYSPEAVACDDSERGRVQAVFELNPG